MASDRDALHLSAIQKLSEFRRLRYPPSVLRGVCTVMATVTATYEWIKIRDVDMVIRGKIESKATGTIS